MINSVKCFSKQIDTLQWWYFLRFLIQYISKFNFCLQLIASPLNILFLSLFSIETMFVSLIERNFKLQLLAACFIYFTVQACAVTLIEVYAIVKSSSSGRHTGVLVHKALYSTNDKDLMLKVWSVYFQGKILSISHQCVFLFS